MRYDLNYGWGFAKGRLNAAIDQPQKGLEPVMIPHCVDLFPTQYISERSYQNEYTYQLVFDLKDDAPVKVLHLDGVMLQFDCYLNGASLGHFISGYLPVEIPVGPFLKPKGNVLTLFVDGREDPTIPPFGKVVDYLTYAGIYREVYLTSHPSSYIQGLFVRGNAKGRIRVRCSVFGEGTPSYTLKKDGEVLASFEGDEFTFSNPKLWSLEDPCLYEFEATLDGDKRSVYFGFRDIMWKPEGFFLNGERVELIGLNRHQTYAYFGPAAPKSLQYEDADLLKSSGVNLIRTSHYPQSEHFLDRCDQIGLLVVDEIPGWQYIGENEKWRANCRDFASRMIVKERNHPCLIAYGLRIDESPDDDELYQELQEIKKKLDPSRPSLGVRNFKDSHCYEDIYAYNDFSCENLEHGVDPSSQLKGGKGRPLLISESNGHMFPTKPFDPTSRRVEHALRHARVLNDAIGDDGYCGAITWCAFDYGTHKDFGSGDHICHHGVYDIYRNPKYAASFFQSQGEEPMIEVASLVQPGDFDAALMPKIYVFTNADYVEMHRGDQRIGRFYPNREDYPNLPHPPIVVDDIIGDTFNEPGISKEDGKKIVATFNYCAQNGYGALRIRDKLLLARLMAKYRLSFSDVYATYAKYVQSWGEGSSLWRFEAYKDGKRFASVSRGPSTDFHLEVKGTRDTLIHGVTYDCLRIRVSKKDQYGTTMPYASDPIEVSTVGPIEIYGPKLFSLYGGQSSVYVRSLPLKSPAEGIVKIRFGEETLEYRILVKPEGYVSKD